MLRTVFLLSAVVTLIYGANILTVMPSVWKSNYVFGRRIVSLLAQRGHNVTVLSAYSSIPQPNVTELKIPNIEKNFVDMGLSFDFEKIRDKSILEHFSKLVYAGTSNVDVIMGSDEVQNMLKSKETKFDLLLIDNFMSDALLGFAVYYNVPTIVISPIGPNKWVNEMVGNVHNSALHPNSFLPLLDEMTLYQRIINTLMSIFEKLTYNCLYMPFHEYLYKRYFGELVTAPAALPSLWDVVHNVSMVLSNSHPVTQYPRAFVPNMIEVGGAHLYSNNSKISLSFDKFLTEAPEGVLYISFGANLKSDDLPKEKFDVLMAAIRKVQGRMRVLLKLESFDLKDQPTHTVIASWLPQQEILAHPNVKVFISTVGLMSMMEAIHYGVPVLGVPIFPEQELNMKRLENLGSGLRVNYDNFTQENLVETIFELLTNPIYRENAQRASALFSTSLSSSSLYSPIDLAVHNIEVVLQTGGARHLQSIAATKLAFIQLELIDVSFIILLGIVMIIAVPSLIICIILRRNNRKRITAEAKNGVKNVSSNLKSKKNKQN